MMERMAKAPTLVPAIAPVDSGFRFGAFPGVVLERGSAEEGDAEDKVDAVELAGGGSGHVLVEPMLISFWSRVARLCQSVKVPASWLTER